MLDQIKNSITKLSDKFEGWLDQLVLMMPNFIIAILIVIGFALVAKLARKLAKRTLGNFSDNVAVTRLLSTIIYVGVIIVGLFVALGVLQLDKTVTSLLAGVGVIGLALGFAFQDTAANFISGVFMATKHPINVGDIVKTNDYFGTVVNINLRFTNIRTPQGQSVIIPNKMILQNPLTNYTISGERRVDLSCGISYGDDLEKVKQVALQAIENHVNYVKEKPIEFMFTEFGDSSINFLLRFWTDNCGQKDFLTLQSDAIIALKQAFDENDIMIPFPIRTLDFGIKGGEKLSSMLQDSNGVTHG